MTVGYFPGCSLHGLGREYDESLHAVCRMLDLELAELSDWACCGATSAHSVDHFLGVALPARTLAIAEKERHKELLAPCAACFSRLATARSEIADDPELSNRVASALGRQFHNSVSVLNIADLFARLSSKIQEKSTKPLTGLKVACYYGCLLVRPDAVTGCADPENPNTLETIVAAAGATPVSWNKRLDCCGGGFSLARTGSVVRLGREIIEDARRAGAEAIVVACPMCHSNLDMRQSAMVARDTGSYSLPVIYITQLVGLALGCEPRMLGLGRHFVDTTELTRFSKKESASSALPPQKDA